MAGATFDNLPPWQKIDDYANIKVETSAGTLKAPVTKYRCLKKFPFAPRGCDDALAVKNALLRTHKDIIKEFGGGQNIVDVFTGKGSVESITTELRVIFKYRDLFVEKHARSRDQNERKAAEILAGHSADTLATFASEFIGLDCNGFVGRYLQPFPATAGLKHDNTPGEWYKALLANNFRKKVKDFEVGDVVISTNFMHIGVVDSVTNFDRIDIAQSGGKIFYSTHKVREGTWKDRGTIFTIDQASGGFSGCPTVYVARAVSNTAHGHISAYVEKT